jgi:multidrug/hemolysin transport system permease protein
MGKGMEGLSGARFLMDSWIVAGLLAVTSFTTTMGAFGTMVEDKSRKITKDFTSSPLKRGSIAAGYTISSYIIGVIMCLITLVLAEVYIVANGGKLMSVDVLFKVLGLILLSTLTNTSIVLFITSFLKSQNAFATASTIIGTIIGFLTGVYLPIGQLPAGVQWVIKLFPVSHAASLIRQEVMSVPLSQTFGNIPADVADHFKQEMGVIFKFGDTTVSPAVSIGILVLTAVVFFGLSVLNMSRKKK